MRLISVQREKKTVLFVGIPRLFTTGYVMVPNRNAAFTESIEEDEL